MVLDTRYFESRPKILSFPPSMMQALQSNAVSTQVITKTQSLGAVQTLLRAGLSCITFLRNLLPEDNFTEGHLTSADESFPTSASDADGTPKGSSKRGRMNGFRIMTLMPGYTDEADRLLNYMENGIFDALEKEYLRSFIFAIYLDSKDPTNIVEAYTFNFKYHTVPGTNTVVPVMSLGDDLQNMSLDGDGKRPVDPVSEAIQRGRAPTVRDVKKSMKTMIKTLIQAITHMEDLPRRRFATFKLFYTEKTPADYEPPNFQSADEQKDRWYFMTHSLDEVPDRFSVGKVNCGYHSINLKVTSIATYLPNPSKDDAAPFSGTLAAKGPHRPRATPNEEALICARQAEELQEDSISRNLVWSTEADAELCDPDADADCEEDPDTEQRTGDAYEQLIDFDRLNEPYLPLGQRIGDGQIEPVQIPLAKETQQEAQFAGMSERVPTRLKEINAEQTPGPVPFEETQALVETQPLITNSHTHDSFTFNLKEPQLTPKPRKNAPAGSLPSSDLAMELESHVGTQSCFDDLPPVNEDAEMLDLETQPADLDSHMMDSIQSFSMDASAAPVDPIQKAPSSSTGPSKDVGLKCDCNITAEDEACFCEGGCGRWYHVWCMGFHSTDDPRLPAKFVCFDCRLRADVVSWIIIKESLYPRIMTDYRDFVLFRRAIKVAENCRTITPIEFAKSFDKDQSLAHRLLKRLEEEDFIKVISTTFDDFGLTVESRGKNGKGKDKKSKGRKKMQKIRYSFNKQIKSQKKYKDYFTPEQEVESRMLGLDDYSKFRNENDHGFAPQAGPVVARNTAVVESQTQEDTQFTQTEGNSGQKRTADACDLEQPLNKKMKISLAVGIDLAE